MAAPIVKNGPGVPKSMSGFAIDVEALKADAEAITLVAQTYGISGADIEHLKQAVFYCTIGSGLVPDSFAGDYRSIFIMSQRAMAMECPLSEVLQGGYFVHGRWGWYAEFMINRAIATGFYARIDYESSGTGDDLVVRAFGIMPDGTRVNGSITGMKMAIKEGWVKNPKYDSMPLYMLKKRAATFLIRETCPHVFGGETRTQDELEDIAAAAHRGTVIDSATATTPQEITNSAMKDAEEQQRLEVFYRVEKRVAEVIAKLGGGGDAVMEIENKLGMGLAQIEKLNIEQLLAVFELLKTIKVPG